ncbi:hypothetical protein [Nocardioides caricicola]|uniref:Uncharacterized protein n=1 Tax=Nocardioides caricicola TaxID=634770 RepID=A0ABW0N098_9ACTN
MTAWTSFALRANTTTPEGQVPSGGSITICPDIIPLPAADPNPTTNFATTQSWAQDYAAQILEGVPNYIYVRAKNWAAGAETADVTLYAVGCALINMPSDWIDNPLTLQDGKTTKQTISATNNQEIAVAPEPWYWVAQPPPSGSDHYCVFALLDSKDNPNPLLHNNVPQTYSDMASLVTNELYVGWKNVALVPTNAVWTHTMKMPLPPRITGDSLLHVYFFGSQGYVGGKVAVSVGDGASFNPPIVIGTPTNPQTINSPSETYGMLTTPVAGEESTYISVSYLGGANPGFNDRVSMVCGWVPSQGSIAEDFKARGLGQALPAHIAAQSREFDGHDGHEIGWEVPIGAMHYDADPSQNQ